MSDSNYKFQLNLKLGSGYDAHLLNIVGDTTLEFANNLGWVQDHAGDLVAVAKAIETAYGVKAIVNNGASVTTVPTQQPAAAPSGAPAPSCRHGAMEYKPAGISKRTNKAYNAFWACTGPRQEQCQSVNA